MVKCNGESCKKHESGVHSAECMFEHFMCYTGGYHEPSDIQEKLKKAYFDGYDAGKNIEPEDAAPLFSAMGMKDPLIPSVSKI